MRKLLFPKPENETIFRSLLRDKGCETRCYMGKTGGERCKRKNHVTMLVAKLKVFLAVIPNFQLVYGEGSLRLGSVVYGGIVWKGQNSRVFLK